MSHISIIVKRCINCKRNGKEDSFKYTVYIQLHLILPLSRGSLIRLFSPVFFLYFSFFFVESRDFFHEKRETKREHKFRGFKNAHLYFWLEINISRWCCFAKCENWSIVFSSLLHASIFHNHITVCIVFQVS